MGKTIKAAISDGPLGYCGALDEWLVYYLDGIQGQWRPVMRHFKTVQDAEIHAARVATKTKLVNVRIEAMQY